MFQLLTGIFWYAPVCTVHLPHTDPPPQPRHGLSEDHGSISPSCFLLQLHCHKSLSIRPPQDETWLHSPTKKAPEVVQLNKTKQNKKPLKFYFKRMYSSANGSYCVLHLSSGSQRYLTDPAIPAQRKRQCLKYLLQTIMYLTLKYASGCLHFFRRALKKTQKTKPERLPAL